MKPAGTEFLFWIIFFSLTFGLWILYELRSWLRRQSRRNLKAPDRSIHRHVSSEWAGRP
jgi:hypothetical protein